jgi:hypothetical protein
MTDPTDGLPGEPAQSTPLTPVPASPEPMSYGSAPLGQPPQGSMPPVPMPPPAAPLGAPVPTPYPYGPGETAGMPPVYPPGTPAYPMSGPPMSGMPMSGPPISGAYGYPPFPMPLPPPPPKRRLAVIVLSIVAGLLLAASAVSTTMLVQKTQDAAKLSNQVDDRDQTIATQRDKSDQLQRDLDAATNRATQSDAAHNAVAACLTSIYDVWDAEDANAAKTKIDELVATFHTKCKEADKYLAARRSG